MKIEGLESFISALENVESGLQDEMRTWLDSLGMMFLDEIQREIIRSQTVDTRRLLNSFSRGNSDNVWSIKNNGLMLEIGTNVQYAKYANDGHFTIDPTTGKDRRWVPGDWVGDRFEYNPGSSNGMLLKFTWVEGSHYFDTANKIFKRMFAKALDKKLAQYINRRFGGR